MTKDGKKIALVTGGTRGIGRGIAEKLADEGYFVIVNFANSETAAKELMAEFKSKGQSGSAYKCDVSQETEVAEMFSRIEQEYGTVDVLVANAGITRDTLVMRMKAEAWHDVIETNLSSLFHLTKAVLRNMMKNRFGRIIAISSIVGLMGNAGQANYAASKAGIIGYIKSIAKEVASRGITANVIAPGFIATDMTALLPDELKEMSIKHIPNGRAGTPEDIANVVSFLANVESNYIQGQVIAVDGGMSLS
ncbi:MAG: 3-oxoacyl-[acyl-carrier-protein] reductase [Synergistaceae bacterium]|nr:3-oxoacyl-[acyl-carrier-protein] reductase [Synergistaceae bacterium]